MLRRFWKTFYPPGVGEPTVIDEDHVDGIPATEYFPRHQFVHMQYRHADDPNLVDVFGTMDFWEKDDPEHSISDITSFFISWRCTRCLRLHHRFTQHRILLPGSDIYHEHCNQGPGPLDNVYADLDVPWGRYPPTLFPPTVCDVAFNVESVDQFGMSVPTYVFTKQRFFIMPCRECEIEHRYVMEGVIFKHPFREDRDNAHYCFDDPLIEDASYRILHELDDEAVGLDDHAPPLGQGDDVGDHRPDEDPAGTTANAGRNDAPPVLDHAPAPSVGHGDDDVADHTAGANGDHRIACRWATVANAVLINAMLLAFLVRELRS